MKFLGTTLLAICPIFFGFLKSKNLKQNQIKIEKIIELINRIITEIRFAKTNTYKIFKNLSLEENFSCLEFLKYFKEKNNLKPFPKAFEESIPNKKLTMCSEVDRQECLKLYQEYNDILDKTNY